MDLKEKAKLKIRFWSNQQKLARKKWKAGEISIDKYMDIYGENKIRIEAVQSVFK